MNQNEGTQNAHLSNQNISDDEIDLFELWEGLVAEKITILAAFLGVMIVAVIYAFSVTPVYKASSYLQPPSQEQIMPMNAVSEVLKANGLTGSTSTTQSVFKSFQTTLGSRQTLKKIFEDYKLVTVFEPEIDRLSGLERLKAEQKAFGKFIKDFSIQLIDKNDVTLGISAQLSLAVTDAEVAEILNALVKQAEQDTIHHLAQQILSEKQARQRLIQQKIDGVRQIEHDRRLDRIAQLDEAIQITQHLKLTKPVSSGPTLNINNMEDSGQNEGVALYLLGSDLLEAEKSVLEQRKNDDAFIENLRGWQEELQLLSSLKVEPSQFGVVQVDQPALFADKVKPKKALILAVAGVLGLMLGVFIALIRRAVKNRKSLAETKLNQAV